MTDSIPLPPPASQLPSRRGGQRGSYLPSVEVLEELARLGRGVSTLAEELRARLSEPADELMHLPASRYGDNLLGSAIRRTGES